VPPGSLPLRQGTDSLLLVTGTKRIFNPSGDTNTLNERMAEVNLAADDFRICAGRVMMKHQDEFFQMQSWMSLQQGEMSRRVQGMDHNLQKLVKDVERAVVLGSVQALAYEALQPVLEGVMRSTCPYTDSGETKSRRLTARRTSREKRAARPSSHGFSTPAGHHDG